MSNDPFIRFAEDLRGRASHAAGAALQIQNYVNKAVVHIGNKASSKAADLTPRYVPGDAYDAAHAPPDHIADSWVADVTADGSDVSVLVHNKHPRANAELVLATGAVPGYTLIEILEYGSAAHRITPVNAPMLVFFWKKYGVLVHSEGVNHPGTKPYSMIGIATIEAHVDAGLVINAVQAASRTIFDGPSVAPMPS